MGDFAYAKVVFLSKSGEINVHDLDYSLLLAVLRQLAVDIVTFE